jgi:hypothetical protein
MHNDAGVLGLSEVPAMQDVEKWEYSRLARGSETHCSSTGQSEPVTLANPGQSNVIRAAMQRLRLASAVSQEKLKRDGSMADWQMPSTEPPAQTLVPLL